MTQDVYTPTETIDTELASAPTGGEAASLPTLPASVSPPVNRKKLWVWGSIGAAVCCVVVLLALKNGSVRHASAGGGSGIANGQGNGGLGALPVNVVHPRKKTLERTLVQPGSIKPWAQAELYAKVSGYLKAIQRTPTYQMAAEIAARGGAPSFSPLASQAGLATSIEIALWRAPQKDIGSVVKAGEVLIEIDTPERIQDIVEKETLVRQRLAELEAARAALATLDAGILSAKAQKTQAEAEIGRYASEYRLRNQELARIKELVQSRTLTQEIADEKEHQVNAALAAWESSKAKAETAQAEIAVISSKLTTARADLKVKEALIQVARDALGQARILADYRLIHAPFDGIITNRGVDEGDFVQNATSGQARFLMTIAAIDKVKVVLQVPESDAPWVRVGTETTVALDALSNWHVRGHVSRTANVLEQQTRTMQVEIDVENRDHKLIPGMYGRVTLTLQRIPDAQAIPATALYSRLGENFIIEAKEGVARKHKVRVRFDDGKEVEVVKLIGGKEIPLNGSEDLIVSNKGEIAEGQRVKTTALTSN